MQNYQRLREVRHITFLSFIRRWDSCIFCSYIKALHGYLTSFLRRSQPLVDYESQSAEQEADFEKKWEAGEVDGWADQVTSKTESNGSQEGIWCLACKQPTQLYGLERHAHHSNTRSKDVLQTNRVRCPSDVQKAHKGNTKTSHLIRTSQEPQRNRRHTLQWLNASPLLYPDKQIQIRRTVHIPHNILAFNPHAGVDRHQIQRRAKVLTYRSGA